MSRKWKLLAALGVAVSIGGGVAGALVLQANHSGPEVVVYKSPSCGCCTKWVSHLRENGFTVVTNHVEDLRAVKASVGVPANLGACHTGLVEGYVVEGHVPADALRRFLEKKPEALGIAVAGMPVGSPGMEGPRPEPYNILTFDRDGQSAVFERR